MKPTNDWHSFQKVTKSITVSSNTIKFSHLDKLHTMLTEFKKANSHLLVMAGVNNAISVM